MTESPIDPDSGNKEDSGSTPPSFNRVEDILKFNLEKQRQHERPIVTEKRKSRKLQDYIICMLLVNAALILPNLLMGSNVVVMIFSFSGIIIFSSGFTWVMWKVIGDY